MPLLSVEVMKGVFTPQQKQDTVSKVTDRMVSIEGKNITDEDFDVMEALALLPACEYCNKALPTDSLEARTCSFECTFCATCVEKVLGNVCPNCGGGFSA